MRDRDRDREKEREGRGQRSFSLLYLNLESDIQQVFLPYVIGHTQPVLVQYKETILSEYRVKRVNIRRWGSPKPPWRLVTQMA